MDNQGAFLHDHPEFKTLLEITARDLGINEPSLVEKDYWIMHCLWSLQRLGLKFHLKGGTSLSKGFGCIHRFSEDIDIKIEPDPNQVGFRVYAGKNHDDERHRESRLRFFNWVATLLDGKISGITSVERDTEFDEIPKYRSGGVRLRYKSHFSPLEGLKDGILLEIGFDKTAPNRPRDIGSWAIEKAFSTSGVSFNDNRAHQVHCYEPQFTFVEKLQAVTRKFRLFKEGKTSRSLPANFIRHYYDIHQLLDLPEVQTFIGTPEYEAFEVERFGGDDTRITNSDAFKLSDPADRSLFEVEYTRTGTLYFRSRPSFEEMLSRIGKELHRL